MESELNDAGQKLLLPAKLLKRNFWGDVFFNFYKVYQTALIVGTLIFILCIGILFVQKNSPYRESTTNKTGIFQQEKNDKLAEIDTDSVTDAQMSDTEGMPEKESSVVPESTPKPTPEPYIPSDDDEEDWDDEEEDWEDEDYWEDEEYSDKEEYIIPDSDTRKLTKSDVKALSDQSLRLARNEIYARHGRRFNDASLQNYFDNLSWYDGFIAPEDFVDSEELSKLERRNAKFIQAEEASR